MNDTTRTNKKITLSYLLITFAIMGLTWGGICIAQQYGYLKNNSNMFYPLYILGGASTTIATFITLMLMCGKVTYKNLIDSHPTIPNFDGKNNEKVHLMCYNVKTEGGLNCNMKKKIFVLLFIVYVVFLVLIVVLKFDGSFDRIMELHSSIIENEKYGIQNTNFILFKSIFPYFKNIAEPYALINIMGNIIPFLPLGFFVSTIIFETRFFKTIVICLLIILAIECTQLVFKIGFFDVDDIFLNSLGCLVGYVISLFFYKTDILWRK